MSPAVIAAIATGLLVLASALLRQEGVPKVDTLWAEDGAVFLRCGYDQSLGCVTQAYQGYLQALSRIVALIASAVPPIAVSMTVASLAALVAALAASVTAWSIAKATANGLAGVVGAAGLGLVWQAGREVLGNTVNLHWVLLAAALSSIACVVVRAPISRGTIALVIAAGLSSALSPLLVLACVVPVLLHRPRAMTLLVVSAVTAGLQVVAELTTQRDIPRGVATGFTEVASFVRTEVIRDGFFGPLPPAVGLAVVGLLTLLLVGVAIAPGDRSTKARILLAIVGLAGVGIAVCAVSIIANRSLNPRYAYMPTALLIAAIALAAGLLAGALTGDPRTRFAGRLIVPVVALLLGVGFAASFRLQARASAGPGIPQQIVAAQMDCPAGSSVTILLSPRPASTDWTLPIACTRIRPP